MLITIAKQYCWLGKASLAKISELDILLRELETQWALSGFDTLAMLSTPYLQLVERVLQVLPSMPGLVISTKLLVADPLSFEELFFRSDSGQSLIAEIHKFEPKLKRVERQENEPVKIEHLPFPTCGNNADDQLASLINSFQHPAMVQWVWQSFSLDQVDRILFVLKELAIPESDRIAAYVAKTAIEQSPKLFSIESTEKTFNEMKSVVNTGIAPEGWTKI